MYIFCGDKRELFSRYKQREDFFPIIGSVIEGKQSGLVYSNRDASPSSFFVVHKFRFAQFIEFESDEVFDEEMKNSFLQTTEPAKYRIYNIGEKWKAYFHGQSDNPHIYIQKGKRQRFIYRDGKIELNTRLVSTLNNNNFDHVNSVFNLDLQSRFWNSKQEALKYSNLVFVSDPNIISVCYGAALSDSKIEIDVATNEAFRKKGYGILAVRAFLNRVMAKNLTPVWDCYSNNEASIALAGSTGFEHLKTYDFYIVTVNS